MNKQCRTFWPPHIIVGGTARPVTTPSPSNCATSPARFCGLSHHLRQQWYLPQTLIWTWSILSILQIKCVIQTSILIRGDLRRGASPFSGNCRYNWRRVVATTIFSRHLQGMTSHFRIGRYRLEISNAIKTYTLNDIHQKGLWWVFQHGFLS